jgi:hypothetical protein
MATAVKMSATSMVTNISESVNARTRRRVVMIVEVLSVSM